MSYAKSSDSHFVRSAVFCKMVPMRNVLYVMWVHTADAGLFR